MRRFLLGLALFGLAACTDEETVAPSPDGVLVQAVLIPSLTRQQILVEQIRVGASPVDSLPFNPSDPITTRYGTPVTDCRVVVYGPAGDSIVAPETRLAGNRGTGLYVLTTRIFSGGMFRSWLVPGNTYTLRITTPTGGVITGSTTIPNAPSTPLTPSVALFDRDTSRLTMSWPRIPDVQRYLINIESPIRPFFALTADTTVTVTGDLRNFTEKLGHVFFPGFRQMVSVAVADEHYYDWVRTIPLQNANARGHLRGAYGFFGSAVVIRAQELDVTLQLRGAIAGSWVAVDNPDARLIPSRLRLYTDATENGTTSISGNYTGEAGSTGGILGEQRGASVQLKVLRDWSSTGIALQVNGELSAGVLTLRVPDTELVITYVQESR